MRTPAYLVLLLLALPLQLSAQDRLARAERAWIEGDVDTAFRLYSMELEADSTNVTALHRVALVEAWNERYEHSLYLLDKALRLAPDYTPAAVETARVLAWSGRHDEARRVVANVLSREPDNVRALEISGNLAAWNGRNEEALEIWERLESLVSEPDAYLVQRARAVAGSGDPERALEMIEPLARAHPDSVEVLEARGQFAYRAGRPEVALESYERAISLAPGVESLQMGRVRALAALGREEEAWSALDRTLRGSDDPAALRERARLAVITERWDEALALYDRLVRMGDNPGPDRVARIRVLASMQRHEEAIDSLDALPAGAAPEPELLRLRAQLSMGAGDLPGALDAYDRLLEIDPDDPTILEAKARVSSWTGAFAESVATYDRLIEIAEDPSPFLLPRARVLAWEGSYDEALRAVDQILADDPTNIEALEAKALFASWAGRYDESLGAYDVLEETGGYEARHALPRARALAYDRRYQEAISAFEEILADDPEDRDALMSLGQVLSWTAQYDSANAVFDRVLELEPAAADARAGKAYVANWSGDLKRGERLWTTLRSEDPENVAYLVGMASNLRSQGRFRESRRMLLEAREMAPDNDGIRDQLALIESALAPQITPMFSFISDSDDNEVTTFGVSASVQLGGPFELQVAGSRKDLQQTNRPELDQQTLDGELALGVRVGSGWMLQGGVGVWEPEGDADGVVTGTFGVTSPGWRKVRGTLAYRRSAYDVTALAVQDPVEVDEVRLDVGARVSDRATWAANVAGASFNGTETNTRLLAGTSFRYRLVPWLQAGPAVRAFGFDKDLNDGYWDPDSYAVLELPFTLGPNQGDFRPSLEIAPGYQRMDPSPNQDDPWSFALRVQASLVYALGPRRQLGIVGAYANSGIQQLSDATDSSYEYRGVRVFLAWAF